MEQQIEMGGVESPSNSGLQPWPLTCSFCTFVPHTIELPLVSYVRVATLSLIKTLVPPLLVSEFRSTIGAQVKQKAGEGRVNSQTREF